MDNVRNEDSYKVMWGVVGKVLALGWSPDVQIMDWTPLGGRGGV